MIPTRKTLVAITTAAALTAPAIAASTADAHTAPKPHLSCGELDGQFTGFPAGPQTVTLHLSVDGVPRPDRVQTGVGPAFDTSTGYTNVDAAAHTVVAYFTWTADGGGRSPTATAVISDCPPPPAGTTTTIIQQVLVPTPVPVPVPTPEVCTSHRIISHRVAQTLFGRLVTGVRANSPGYKTTVTKTDGRWTVHVDVRGEQFTGFNNNVRTRVVVKLGRRAATTRPIAKTGWWRTVYKADTCRSRKGAADQNDVSSRTPLIPVPSNAVSAFLAR